MQVRDYVKKHDDKAQQPASFNGLYLTIPLTTC